ncbi:hypothetical protein P353_19835 [Comamonas testosteroni]|uniref:Uncharacterized protein n=1 Tax=Comamonas testosteroni TaxID=285 RepID=A0A096HDY7_COMTE|nr:hypothetical protein P353_19835 [Comamonas testosteroni]
MTTHHTDEKKPALGGLVEDAFWKEARALQLRADRGELNAALELYGLTLKFIKTRHNSDGAAEQDLRRGCNHAFGHHIRNKIGLLICTACLGVIDQ